MEESSCFGWVSIVVRRPKSSECAPVYGRARRIDDVYCEVEFVGVVTKMRRILAYELFECCSAHQQRDE